MLSFVAEHSREDYAALIRPAGELLTYGALAMATAAVRQALEARVGDVAQRLVGIAVSDGAQLVAALLAVLESGGVALPLDARRGLVAVADEARRARAVALISGDSDEDRLDLEPIDPTRLALPPDTALALAAGPRRALFSRAAIVSGVDAMVQSSSLTVQTRMALLPPLWSGPVLLGQALATLRAGGTLIDVGQLEPAAQLDALARLDGNCLTGFPAQLDTLARAVNDQGAPRPNLTRVIGCAPSLTPPLADDLRRAFPDAVVIAAHDSPEALRIAGDRAHAGMSVSLDGDELLLRAPWMMLGYLHDAPATRNAFITRENEPWLKTGWRARLDGEKLFFDTRSDGTIEIDGERIDPTALENELRALPNVRQAAVLVIPDRRLGPRLVAFVAGDGKFTRPPARIVTLVSLPQSPDGAIDRQALRRMASAE